jgi:hypothetical protein
MAGVRIRAGRAYEVMQDERRWATEGFTKELQQLGLNVDLEIIDYVPGRRGLGPVEWTEIFIGTTVATSIITNLTNDLYQRTKDMLRSRRKATIQRLSKSSTFTERVESRSRRLGTVADDDSSLKACAARRGRSGRSPASWVSVAKASSCSSRASKSAWFSARHGWVTTYSPRSAASLASSRFLISSTDGPGGRCFARSSLRSCSSAASLASARVTASCFCCSARDSMLPQPPTIRAMPAKLTVPRRPAPALRRTTADPYSLRPGQHLDVR